MTLSYLVVVGLLVIAPGADSILVIRNTILAGRGAGITTSLGVSAASAAQGGLTSFGVGALIVSSQPLFWALKWAGAAYLVWLGIWSLRAAWRGEYDAGLGDGGNGAARFFRQGLLCNITNPKMFVFYLALLPQFVAPSDATGIWLAHALVVPLIGTAWLAILTLATTRARTFLLCRAARRTLDVTAGVILLSFGERLANEA